jgi:hypothetical protein
MLCVSICNSPWCSSCRALSAAKSNGGGPSPPKERRSATDESGSVDIYRYHRFASTQLQIYRPRITAVLISTQPSPNKVGLEADQHIRIANSTVMCYGWHKKISGVGACVCVLLLPFARG